MAPRSLALALTLLSAHALPAQPSGTGGAGVRVAVRTDAEFRAALAAARPGTRIELAPGEYRGGSHCRELRGAPGRPIVVAGADPERPPHFVGGEEGLHLVDPWHVELQDLHFTGATGNGVNLDDGGRYAAEPRGLVLRRLRIADVGPDGNRDGIKLSGLRGFRVADCVIERWGRGGSGIDMVGCHAGEITGCTLRHDDEAGTTGANGIQAKGGSRDLVIRGNRLEHVGGRGLNLGGSTGLEYFRPALDQWPGTERYEAAAILVEGNTIVGGGAPIAFVGVDGATVRFNTIVDPGRFAIRILQETRQPGFVPARRGVFTDNVVVFRSARWSSGGVNVGSGTAPETFEFARNVWFCRDRPAESRPNLPVPEREGLYGVDPLLGADHRLGRNSPARGRGADAAPPVQPPPRAR